MEEHQAYFALEKEGRVSKKERIYADGDLLYAEVQGGAEDYAEHFVELDGHRLCPIVKYYKVPENVAARSSQKILF